MNRVALGILLLLFPRRWRARYGDELTELVADSVAAGHSPWRVGGDLVRAAAVERARGLGLVGSGFGRADRVTGGCLAVLWAWIAFVVAGTVVQKTSEHWQGALPGGERAVPAAAFAVLVIGAAVASVVVLAGIALTVPRIGALFTAGGWGTFRGPVLRAAGLTLVVGVGAAGLVIWAHRLGPAQRNGADHPYGAAFVGLALAGVAVLIAWTSIAARIARCVGLGRRVLLVETALASVTTLTMAVVSAASLVWWCAVAGVAPGFFGGGPAGGPVAAAVALMMVATLVGAAGSARAIRELRHA